MPAAAVTQHLARYMNADRRKSLLVPAQQKDPPDLCHPQGLHRATTPSLSRGDDHVLQKPPPHRRHGEAGHARLEQHVPIVVGEGQDRGFLNQDGLGLPIEPQALGGIVHTLGLGHEILVALVAPAGLPANGR